jgi:hypothetical protein
MASSKGVSATQSDDFLVIETHTIENVSKMFISFGTIRKTTIGSASGDIFIGSAGSPWNNWAAHFLNGSNTGKSPEIRVGDPREFLLDGFKMITSNFKTGIGTMIRLGSETLH